MTNDTIIEAMTDWCYTEVEKALDKARADTKTDIAKECKYLLACGMGKKKSLEHLIKILEKEQKND